MYKVSIYNNTNNLTLCKSLLNIAINFPMQAKLDKHYLPLLFAQLENICDANYVYVNFEIFDSY